MGIVNSVITVEGLSGLMSVGMDLTTQTRKPHNPL